MHNALVSELIKEAVKSNSSQEFIIERGIYRRKVYTYQNIHNNALSICAFLKDQKIKKGDKIIIYLPNSSDYASLLFACALSGIIAVPIDFNVNPAFAEKIALKTKAKLTFCSIYKQPSLKQLFLQEQMQLIYRDFLPKNSIINKNLKPQDIFEIVYTSGTTSEPKGVVLTNENIYSNVLAMRKIITFNAKHKSILSMLPLSHLFEQTSGFLCPISQGVKIVYSQSKKPSNILKAINEEKILATVTVPLFLQSLKEKIEFEAEKQNKLHFLRSNLKRFSKFPNSVKKIIFRMVRKKLGHLKYFIVGGAALPVEIEQFWNDLGIIVLQGYGLTESSPVVACNSEKEHLIGSVGKALDGVQIKIHDGEILVKGKNVFKGYYGDNEKTKQSIKAGWLHTGDLGAIDNEGYLKLIGRKKNVIISPSGLNVYPEDIERVIYEFKEVKECVVLGLDSGRKIVSAMIANQKLSEKDLVGLLQKINSKLQPHQIISEIYLWHESEFPKTSTLKIKRGLVEEGLISRKISKIEEKSSDKLLNIISEICDKPSKDLKEETILVNLGLDSIKRIELSIRIEENFNLDFNEDSVNDKTTISNLRELIKKHEKIITESGIGSLNSRAFNWPRAILQNLTFLLLKPWYSLEIKGLENLGSTNVIFIANHASHFDTPLILKALPPKMRKNTFIAAAKDYFFKNKLKGGFLRLLWNIFAFSRTEHIKQSLLDFGKLIDTGGNILIYPEGTRTTTGKIGEFKTGIALLAQNMDVPVIPIRLKGTYEILPKGKLIPKRGKVDVIFGKPMSFDKTTSFSEITHLLKEAIEKLN